MSPVCVWTSKDLARSTPKGDENSPAPLHGPTTSWLYSMTSKMRQLREAPRPEPGTAFAEARCASHARRQSTRSRPAAICPRYLGPSRSLSSSAGISEGDLPGRRACLNGSCRRWAWHSACSLQRRGWAARPAWRRSRGVRDLCRYFYAIALRVLQSRSGRRQAQLLSGLPHATSDRSRSGLRGPLARRPAHRGRPTVGAFLMRQFGGADSAPRTPGSTPPLTGSVPGRAPSGTGCPS